MNCTDFMFSNHAIAQMFNRGISVDAVEDSIINGEKIKSYPDDIPYPSYLILYFISNKPIHVVVSQDIRSGLCFVITTYHPDPALWDTDFKNKN